jgi:hypothetical protein
MTEKGETIKWIKNPNRFKPFYIGIIFFSFLFSLMIIMIYFLGGPYICIIGFIPFTLFSFYMVYLGMPNEFGFSKKGLNIKYLNFLDSGNKVIFFNWDHILFFKSGIVIDENGKNERFRTYSPKYDSEFIKNQYEKLIGKKVNYVESNTIWSVKMAAKIEKQKEKKVKICENCNGTGKMLKYLRCTWCDGTGVDNRKVDERPIICVFCGNRGTCNRCKGTKFQKKYRIFGSKIICKKCDGSGICPICKDAPNGGYYITWYMNDDARYTGLREIRETNKKIKELAKEWEELKITNKEILRFEDFIKLPSYNEQDKMPSNEPSMLLFHLVEVEVNRYEQYLSENK